MSVAEVPRSSEVDDFEYSPRDVRVRQAMVERMATSKHGVAFTPRELDKEKDPFRVLSTDLPHLDARPFDQKEHDRLKEILGKVLVTPESFEKCVDTIYEILTDPEVIEHLEGGGNLIFATSHISYIDLPALLMALAEAKLRASNGESADTENHHVIIGRMVGLFKMAGLGKDFSEGYVVDDGLLRLGGVFQTVPISETGSVVTEDDTKEINGIFGPKYNDIINKGGQIIVFAPSGEQHKINDIGQSVMKYVKKGSARLIFMGNRSSDKNRTYGTFIDCQPFDGEGNFRGPADLVIAVGEPFFPHTAKEVQEILMPGVEALGNQHRHSFTPEIVYERKPSGLIVGSAATKSAMSNKA